MAENGDISPGELARRVGEVLTRFQQLVDLIENRYVRLDILALYKETINQAIEQMKNSLNEKADKTGLASLDKKADNDKVDALEKRLASMEDNQKWLVRAVLLLVIAGVFAAVFTAGGGGLGK